MANLGRSSLDAFQKRAIARLGVAGSNVMLSIGEVKSLAVFGNSYQDEIAGIIGELERAKAGILNLVSRIELKSPVG